jgi:4-hydroxy-2-oxoheptanedioate aldolase
VRENLRVDTVDRPTTLGIWQQLPSPMVSRYLAQMGWQWIILDLQHGPMSFETAYECVHTIRSIGAKPLVRVSVGNPGEVQKALDIGAAGVIVPMVNSLAEARAVAAASKYPPLGERSLGGDASILMGEDYPEAANRDTLLLVQVEHIDSVNDVEQIMSLDGVDGCFIGPVDLALSMRLPRTGYREDPDHRQAIQRTLDACHTNGKMACCNAYSLKDFQEKVAQGFKGVTFKSEVDLFVSSGQNLLRQLREDTTTREKDSKVPLAAQEVVSR